MSDKKKPITPYARLLEEAREYATKVEYPHTVNMWKYDADKLKMLYSMNELYDRVQAAHQLGYDVVLIANEEGLHVKYRKQMPSRPWTWR